MPVSLESPASSAQTTSCLGSSGWTVRGCRGSHAVDLTRTDDLDAIRADKGVPDEAAGCHLAEVEGYVVEGHVPVAAFEKLLAERPAVDGIALPGMPQGSPGMGDGGGPFEIVSFTGGVVAPFMTA